MSEAPVAMSGSWTERTFGSARRRFEARPAPRSLKAALSEAGLGDTADARDTPDGNTGEAGETPPRRAPAIETAPLPVMAPRSPRLAYFAEQATPHTVATPTQGVVSPPPWLRAARRGRRHARMLNTFGWLTTLIVAGSIIGLAGRYLAVPPLGIATTLHQARQ